MTYKITVEVVEKVPEERYPKTDLIYQQIVCTEYTEWLENVIKAVNELQAE